MSDPVSPRMLRNVIILAVSTVCVYLGIAYLIWWR
jgi:hypothetical protein